MRLGVRKFLVTLVLCSEELRHGRSLLSDVISGLGLEADAQLVVDEADDHALVQRDHVGRHVVLHLLQRLKEHVGAVT